MTDLRALGWPALSFVSGTACCVLARFVANTAIRVPRQGAGTHAAASLDASLQRALRRAAVSGIFAQLIALLGLTWLFATMFFAFGGREAVALADGILPGVPLLLVGFAAGAALAATWMVARAHAHEEGAHAGERVAVAAAETVAMLCLGGAIEQTNGGELDALGVAIFPLLMRAFGIVASIGGVIAVKADGNAAFPALRRGLFATLFASSIGIAGAAYWLLGPYWTLFGACGLLGTAATLAVLALPEPRRPWQLALLLGAMILACHLLGERSGLSHAAPYGIAIAAGGTLSAAAYLHAMNAFGAMTHEAPPFGGQRSAVPPLAFAAARARDFTRAHMALSSSLVLFAVIAAYLDATSHYACVAAPGCEPLSRTTIAIDPAIPAVLAAALVGAALAVRLATPRTPFTLLTLGIVVAPLALGVLAARLVGQGPAALGALLIAATITTLFLTRRSPLLPIATLAMATLALMIGPLIVL